MYPVKRWKEVLTIISGKNQKAVENPDGKYPIYGSGGVIGRANDYLCKEQTVIVGRKGTINNPIFVSEPFWNIDTAFGVVAGDELMPKFLYYFCCLFNFKTLDKSTGRPSLAKSDLMKIEMPVPSLSEQGRIVARIEELFSELDKAVETLQTTKRQLEVYRQAVLMEAYTGNLTASWRAANCEILGKELLEKINNSNVVGHYEMMENIELPELPPQWTWTSIGNISTGAEYGTSKKSIKNGRVPVLRMGNIQNGTLNWDDLVYSNDEDEISKYSLHDGDVLFNRTNSPDLVGKTAVFKGDRPAIYAGYLIRINQVKEIESDYLGNYMNGYIAKQYGNKVKTDGVNQSNINGKKLYSYPFPLCSQEEQRQVVYELDSRLSVCDSIEQTVDTALAQADALRQSILKEAFEGRLV